MRFLFNQKHSLQSFSNQEKKHLKHMPIQSPQLLPLFSRMYFLSKIITLCLLSATARYLLMLCTELACRTGNIEQEQKEKEYEEQVAQMRSIYHGLLAWLYILFFVGAFVLPLQLLSQISIKLALPLGILLLILCGELVPRILLQKHHFPSNLAKWSWLVNLAKIIEKIIPFNRLLKPIFGKNNKKQETQNLLTRDNVHKLLPYLVYIADTTEQRPVRQQQVQLLQKIRQLQVVQVKTILVPRKNIFLLDIQAKLTNKLLNHLGRYYFSKILVYSRKEDNIVGYLHFKQLLGFEIDQRISTQPLSVCKNVITVKQDDKLSTAIEMMIQKKANFALVRGKDNEFVGLVKLKDIFSKLLLKWYNYGGLAADTTFHSVSSLSWAKEKGNATLEQAEEQA